MNYADWTPYDLREALELVGPEPPADLLEACLQRGEAMTPELVEVLEDGIDESWGEDDPRRWQPVHAALLLAERADPALWPFVERALREGEDEQTLEWVIPRLSRYGADAVTFMEGIATDAEADNQARVGALVALGELIQHEELREDAAAVLRGALPPVSEEGELQLPEGEDEQEAEERWTWAAAGLMQGRDEAARPQVEALFEDGWIDEEVFDPALYDEVMDEPYEAAEMPALPDYYTEQHERMAAAEAELAQSEEMMAQFEQVQEMLGMSDEEMAGFMERLERLADDEGNVDEVQAQAMIQQELQKRGGPQGRIRGTVETFEREEPKYGRNDRVVVEHEESGEQRTLKYKKAERMVDDGWRIVGLA